MTALRFWAGGPVRPNEYFYAIRPEDDSLTSYLARGQHCHLVGPRQIGKTSLIQRAEVRLQEQGTRTARISLDGLGSGPPEEWFLDLLDGVARGFGLPVACWDQSDGMPPEERWRRALKEMLRAFPEHAVVFFDEIDVALESTGGGRLSFLESLAKVHRMRGTDEDYDRISFCLIGATPSRELLAGWGTDIFASIRLRDLTAEQAQVFEPGFRGLPVTLDAVYEETLGHPHMIQRIGEALAEDEVSFSDLQTLLAQEFPERYTQFEVVSKYFVGSSRTAQWKEMLNLYERLLQDERVAYFPEDEVQMQLETTGLVTVRPDPVERLTLQVRNPIYRRNFGSYWVRQVRTTQVDEGEHGKLD